MRNQDGCGSACAQGVHRSAENSVPVYHVHYRKIFCCFDRSTWELLLGLHMLQNRIGFSPFIVLPLAEQRANAAHGQIRQNRKINAQHHLIGVELRVYSCVGLSSFLLL